MNIINKIFNFFNAKHESKQTIQAEDIKFSSLIKRINQNIIDANESLEYIGLKYIEQYFDQQPEVDRVDKIHHKLGVLEKQLNSGNIGAANVLIDDLKNNVTQLKNPIQSNSRSYSPKMTSFEIPVFKGGLWQTEVLKIPLFLLFPLQIPQIKQLTLTSKLQKVGHHDDEIYVRFMHDKPASKWRKSKIPTDENIAEIKIAIQPERSKQQLDDVISHYEKILGSH